MQLQVTFLTIFPEMLPGPLAFSLSGKALKMGLWSYNVVNIRDFGLTRHKKVDDQPCGGGSGMIMRPDVLAAAIDFAIKTYGGNKIFYMSPRGQHLQQAKIKEILDSNQSQQRIIIICGRFEGIDQRIITYYNVDEISVGDFVLSGGELAAMIMVDACVRLLDGVVSSQESVVCDSFSMEGEFSGLLEYSLYTKPAVWNGMHVPDVLLSGNHQEIKKWQLRAAQEITKSRRPDLWQSYISKNK